MEDGLFAEAHDHLLLHQWRLRLQRERDAAAIAAAAAGGASTASPAARQRLQAALARQQRAAKSISAWASPAGLAQAAGESEHPASSLPLSPLSPARGALPPLSSPARSLSAASITGKSDSPATSPSGASAFMTQWDGDVAAAAGGAAAAEHVPPPPPFQRSRSESPSAATAAYLAAPPVLPRIVAEEEGAAESADACTDGAPSPLHPHLLPVRLSPASRRRASKREGAGGPGGFGGDALARMRSVRRMAPQGGPRRAASSDGGGDGGDDVGGCSGGHGGISTVVARAASVASIRALPGGPQTLLSCRFEGEAGMRTQLNLPALHALLGAAEAAADGSAGKGEAPRVQASASLPTLLPLAPVAISSPDPHPSTATSMLCAPLLARPACAQEAADAAALQQLPVQPLPLALVMLQACVGRMGDAHFVGDGASPLRRHTHSLLTSHALAALAAADASARLGGDVCEVRTSLQRCPSRPLRSSCLAGWTRSAWEWRAGCTCCCRYAAAPLSAPVRQPLMRLALQVMRAQCESERVQVRAAQLLWRLCCNSSMNAGERFAVCDRGSVRV